MIKIIECTKCQAPQVFKPEAMDSEIPVALFVNLDGGYCNFIDNIFDGDEFKLVLCHKCAHEFSEWAGLATMAHQGHPNTDEPFCNGWRFDQT